MSNIKKEQNFDSLSEAEKITGKSYKEDETTSWLGLAMHLDHVKRMESLMNSTNDTKFSEKTENYISKVTEFGFEEVYRESFIDIKWDNKQECFYVFWHKEYSILLCFDTFKGNRNGGNFYYNWIPNDRSQYGVTSSGGYKTFDMKPDLSGELLYDEEKPKFNDYVWEEFKDKDKEYQLRLNAFRKENGLLSIWSGHHDCREALKNNINVLVQNGTFMKDWHDKNAHLWLVHHGDNFNNASGFDYKKAINDRIKKLPTFIQKIIR
jgi:hypothetical protein